MKLIDTLVPILASSALAAAQRDPTGLKDCGFARYYSAEYTCYDGDFLCPIIDGKATLRCGPDCYDPAVYSCANDRLVQGPSNTTTTIQPASNASPDNGSSTQCSSGPRILQISDPPYENYFYSDCNSATQVVLTSPLPDSNLTVIGPRLIFAWPAGNSGVCAFFAPENGVNGTLSIALQNSSIGNPLKAVYEVGSGDDNPVVGVEGVIRFNSSAILTVPILGSVRTRRDLVYFSRSFRTQTTSPSKMME